MKKISATAASRLKLLFCLLCLGAMQAAGNEGFAGVPALRHQSWGVSTSLGGHMDRIRGLPQISARAIIEGPGGLIWIGTENGIARFDGLDFEVFNSRNTPALTSGWIDALYADADGSVWVSSADGVLVVRDQVFERVHRAETGFRGARFTQTNDGSLWLGGSSLWRLQEEGLQIAPFHTGGVSDLVAVNDDLWVVDQNQRLIVYSAQAPTVLDPSLWRDQEIRKLLVFHGAPHVVTQQSVFKLKRLEGEWSSDELSLNSSVSLVTAASGEDLVVLDSEGQLYVFEDSDSPSPGRAKLDSLAKPDTSLWRRLVLPEPVPLDLSPVAMAVDSRHSIWAGLSTAGLHHYWASVVVREAPDLAIANAKVWSFFVDDTAYAVSDDGIYRRRGNSDWTLDIAASEVEGARPYSFWQGHSGQYLGTRSGLYWRASDDQAFTKMTALGDRQANLLVPKGDQLYIASMRGLFIYSPTTGVMDKVSGVADRAVRTLLDASDGNFWVGTQSGLLIFDESGKPLPVDEHLAVAFVTGIVEFARGWVAVSTYGRGLFVRSPAGDWANYDADDGLPFQDFFSITAESGWLWGSAASGLMRFRITALLNNEARPDVLLRDDGVFTDRSRLRCCNGAGALRSVAHGGRLYLPTLEGVLKVPLDAPIPQAHPPMIKAAWKHNERLPLSENYSLAEDERDIELAFTAPHFDSDNVPEFRYRLTPLQDEWLYSGDRKVAFFTNLPSGKSTFELQSRVGASGWLSGPEVVFEVEPHLHETWYARVSMAIAAILLVWLLLSYRTQQLHKRAMLLKRTVAERTAEAEAASRAMLETAKDSQRLIREANAPIVTVSSDGNIIDWNIAAEKLAGWQANEVVGSNIEDILIDATPPASAQALFELLREQGTVDGIRLSFSNRSGRRITVLLGGTLLPAFYNVPERLVLVGQDLTDYLEREQQLIQASKMSTLGEMATGMAHELNQPLNAIKLATTNMSRKLEKDPSDTATFPDKLQRVSEQVERARKIIDHLRLYGRRSGTAEGEAKTAFDPHVPVADALSMFREQLGLESIELREDFAPDNCSVLGDPLLLEQVIMNLVGNSRDAIKEHRQAGAGSFIHIRTFVAGKLFVVEVEDSGGGVSDETMLNMFQPFYTTKPPGKGTGLGLSISYGCIRSMSGDITARIGEQGLIVAIELPILSPEKLGIAVQDEGQ